MFKQFGATTFIRRTLSKTTLSGTYNDTVLCWLHLAECRSA